MRSMKFLSIVFCVILLTGSAVFAGQLDADLQQTLRSKQADDLIRVWIAVDDGHDAYAFKNTIAATSASRAERHRIAITELKANAQAQSGLLAELETLRKSGKVTRFKGHWIAGIVEVEIAAGELERLAARPDIDIVYHKPEIALIPPIAVSRLTPPSTDALAVGSDLTHINAPTAWAMGYTGAGRVVCSFDTGVHGVHPALFSSWKGHDGDSAAAWWDQQDDNPFPHYFSAASQPAHGTHTMGTMVGHDGADTVGVAPGAKWISAAVIGLDNTSILDAFEWAADPDGNPNTLGDVPDVINHSWYFVSFPSCLNAVYSAIENTEALGIVNIISAGNSGSGASTIANPADRALDNLDCFAVGNLNHATDTIYQSSSRGPSPCNASAYKPNVVAPGVNIRSTWTDGGYSPLTGTSMAAPHVSGLVALMRQKNPNATADEIKSAILNNTQSVGPSALPNNDYGWGEIDCVAALNAISPESTPAVRLYDFIHDPINPGDTVSGSLVLTNLGATVQSVSVSITGSNEALTVLDGSAAFGTIAAGATVTASDPVQVVVADTVTEGSTLPIQMTIAGTSYSSTTTLYFSVEPDLERDIATHNVGRIEFSVSNYGVYGLGPISTFEFGGVGFTFDGGSNDLWEGGVMVTTGPTRVSSGVHSTLSDPDRDFVVAPGGNLEFMNPGSASTQQTVCKYEDSNANNPIGLEVTQESFAQASPNDDFIVLNYVLNNISGGTLTDVYFGLFFDWDITQYNSNAGGYEAGEWFAWMAYNSGGTLSRYRGVRLIKGTLASAGADLGSNYTAGVGDGFAVYEKYAMLTSGMTNADTYKTSSEELVQYMAAGPITLAAGEQDTVAFAILAGDSFADIQSAAARANSVPSHADDPEPPGELPEDFTLYQNYPNPFNPKTVIPFDLPRRGEFELTVYNALGQKVHNEKGTGGPGRKTVIWNASRFASGVYFYRVTSDAGESTRKMLLLR